MGVLLETDVSFNTSSTWRIVRETDPMRGKWVDFTGMRLSDQWLRHGRNPNIRTETPNAREPFTIDQHANEIAIYDNGVNYLFAPDLLDTTSTNSINESYMIDSDTGQIVLVGAVDTKRRTIPAVVIGREIDGRRQLLHTLIPKVPAQR